MDFELGDLVEFTLVSTKGYPSLVKQGVIIAMYLAGGILAYHPIRGNMHYGVFKDDLKSEGWLIAKLPDEKANFRLDLYRKEKK